MADLLWADFVNEDGNHMSKRGVSFAAGPDIAAKFMHLNNLQLIVRSHEMKEEGYELQKGGRVVTVFSAPNYCDQSGNKGAFINFTAPDLKPVYTQFIASVILSLCANHVLATSKQTSDGICISIYDVLTIELYQFYIPC